MLIIIGIILPSIYQAIFIAIAFANNDIDTKRQNFFYVYVFFPKENFVGGPPTPSGHPPANPSTPDNYYTELIKVEKIDGTKEFPYKLFAQLIDAQGRTCNRNIRSMATDFEYKYMMSLSQSGERFYPSCKIIYPQDYKGGRGIGYSSDGFEPQYVVPLFNICPPKNIFKNSELNGYVYNGTSATIYSQEKQKGKIILTIKKYRLDKPLSQKDMTFKEYKKDIIEIIDKSEAILIYQEKQEWLKADDWLWLSMERRNSSGNILYYCNRANEKSEKVKIPQNIIQ
jgi:hypothetical protein